MPVSPSAVPGSVRDLIFVCGENQLHGRTMKQHEQNTSKSNAGKVREEGRVGREEQEESKEKRGTMRTEADAEERAGRQFMTPHVNLLGFPSKIEAAVGSHP